MLEVCGDCYSEYDMLVPKNKLGLRPFERYDKLGLRPYESQEYW